MFLDFVTLQKPAAASPDVQPPLLVTCDPNHIIANGLVSDCPPVWQEAGMYTIYDVRAAEKKIQELLRALNETDMVSRDDLHEKLRTATDEYVQAIADLKVS